MSVKKSLTVLVSCKYSNNFFCPTRFMLGLAAVPSIIMFFGCLLLPESPRWLVSRGYSERARNVLVKLRGASADVSEELLAMKNVCEEESSMFQSSKCLAAKCSYPTVDLSVCLPVCLSFQFCVCLSKEVSF